MFLDQVKCITSLTTKNFFSSFRRYGTVDEWISKKCCHPKWTRLRNEKMPLFRKRMNANVNWRCLVGIPLALLWRVWNADIAAWSIRPHSYAERMVVTPLRPVWKNSFWCRPGVAVLSHKTNPYITFEINNFTKKLVKLLIR